MQISRVCTISAVLFQVGIALPTSANNAQALLPPVLLRLPTGATRPQGWLKDELELQAKGITGQLPYFWHFLNQSKWLDGTTGGGGASQQYVPYYSNGLFPLSYQVDDDNLNAIRDHYLQAILGFQNITNDSGWLGPPIPPVNTMVRDGPAQELVTKYWMVEALESHAEGAGYPAQIERALLAHHQQMFTQVSAGTPSLNITRWGFSRYSDCLVGIMWLIDRGHGDTHPFLFDLIRLVRVESDKTMMNVINADGGGYSWQSWFDSGDPFAFANDGEITGAVHLRRHGVDIGEAMKTGALWWRVDGNKTDLNNPYTALMWGEKYLHMSDGMYFADEEITSKGSGPQPTGNKSGGHTAGRGTETCSVVETMFSMRTAYEVSGNITFMDRLERLAFNSLPAALWPDVTANVYHHRSNQLNCEGQYGFNLFFCCSSNVHQGWPKFLLSSVHTLIDDTVVISGYAPSITTIAPSLLTGGSGTVGEKLSGNVILINGSYPFSDVVTITTSQPTHLRLRIPCFVDSAMITVITGDHADDHDHDRDRDHGEQTNNETHTVDPCTFFNVTSNQGGTITITFANSIRVYRGWIANKTDGSYGGRGQSPAGPNGGSIELHRGPLTYALRPNSTVVATPIGCIGGKPSGRFGWNCSTTPGGIPQFPHIKSRDVTVTTTPGSGGNWSYAILPETAKFVNTGARVARIPFSDTDPSPVGITVQARNLNLCGKTGWQDPSVPPHSPLISDSPLETILLVPFGATNIRISVFPELLN